MMFLFSYIKGIYSSVFVNKLKIVTVISIFHRCAALVASQILKKVLFEGTTQEHHEKINTYLEFPDFMDQKQKKKLILLNNNIRVFQDVF